MLVTFWVARMSQTSKTQQQISLRYLRLPGNQTTFLTCSISSFLVQAVPFAPSHSPFREAAVVQLSTPTQAIVIQFTKKTGRPCTACYDVLRCMVLENDLVIKAGCGIEDDMIHLFNLYERDCSLLQATSRLELGGVGARDPGHTVGLKSLTAAVLGLELPKPKRLVRSDWARMPLTYNQVVYAARDAWAAAAVVQRLAPADPRRFGARALHRRLQSQPSVRDLTWRRERRQHAKAMTRLVRQARAVGELSTTQEHEWLRELKRIKRDNCHIPPQQYPLASHYYCSYIESPAVTPSSPVLVFNQTGQEF